MFSESKRSFELETKPETNESPCAIDTVKQRRFKGRG